MKSLPTRENMDKFVYRLETSYKAEIRSLKTSLANSQSKIDILDSRLALMDQKMAQLEEKNVESDRNLKYIMTILDELEGCQKQQE